MEIELVEGCICDSFTIDGKDVIDLTDSEMKTYIVKALDKLNADDLNAVLRDIVERNGYNETLARCEECGDYVERYTFEL